MTVPAKKILIVDNDSKAITLMHRRLKNYGYEDVVWAATAAEGLRKVKTEPVHLVIVVTELPDADGFELCRGIKDIHSDKVKVILMTGLAEMVNVVRALEAGADDYVVRTSDYTFLMEAVKRIFA